MVARREPLPGGRVAPGQEGLLEAGRAVKGAIVDAKPAPDGVAALVSSRVRGSASTARPGSCSCDERWSPPDASGAWGEVLARSIEVAWPQITVRGVDVTAFIRGQQGL